MLQKVQHASSGGVLHGASPGWLKYTVYSVAGCHRGYRWQVGIKFYVILYGKCITLYLLVTLSNLLFLFLLLVVMTVHLRTYFYTVNLLRLNVHTYSFSLIIFPFHIQPLLVALFHDYMHAILENRLG